MSTVAETYRELMKPAFDNDRGLVILVHKLPEHMQTPTAVYQADCLDHHAQGKTLQSTVARLMSYLASMGIT